ncbi:DUF2971 domain-containing protein [Paenibacillus shenyangensis]|uniref:DUF2971 domain-containing protein n=1 Tax=Paenibacillus sp. A9 TaxID=1284352 RepID=UPI000378CAA9|nr:DUF2971 domain-containing protein [Paenibacillus sp. A9]
MSERTVLDDMYEEFNDNLGSHQLMDNEFNTLYHYTSIHGLEGIISKGEFWVTHVKYMNDSSESIYFWEVLDQVIESFIKKNPSASARKDFVNKLSQIKSHHSRLLGLTEQYVLSFSTQSDSLSMWNYYGRNDGYCLGFSKIEMIELMNKLNETKNVGIVLAAQVIYDKALQIKILSEELESAYNWFLENKDDEKWQELGSERFTRAIIDYALIRFSTYSSFFKHPGFRDEAEFRVYIRRQYSSAPNYRPYQGIMVPYIKVSVKTESDEIPLQSINVGPLIKHDLAVEGLQRWLKTQLLTKPVEAIAITQSTIPLRF